LPILSADPIFEVHCQLGEGPLWHPDEKRLYWVDITGQDLFRTDTALTEVEHFHFGTTIGAFGFHRDGGLILATGKGFAFWQPGDTEPEWLWNPLPTDRPEVRMNDGKVDPAGRFWAGSIDTGKIEAELYRIDPDGGQHAILHKMGISNGLGWSPDRKTMYVTDSHRYTIDAFDYDLATGEISNRRSFIQLPKDEHEIVPDGLCVDAEGCLWSAHWNGWRVVRYSPQGEPLLTVEVPVQRPTSCCFGGEANDRLFITSSRSEFSEDQLKGQPYAGDVFVLRTDTQGQGTNFFGRTTLH
jgi:sugar lactone lactonase YvrE